MKYLNRLLKNEKGFTFIESLLSLFIFMMISIFLVMFLTTLFFRVYSQSIHPFEWENFVRQIQEDLRESADWEVKEGIFTFTMPDGRVATYNKYQNLLRKQVAGLGHEVLLQNISQVKCKEIPEGVQFEITDTSGKIFQRNIIHIGNAEVMK